MTSATDPGVGATPPPAHQSQPTQSSQPTQPTPPGPASATDGPNSTQPAEPTVKATKLGKSTCASAVCWPPFSRLKSYLDRLKFELATLPTLSSESQAFLDLYAKSLQGGLGKTFLPRHSGNGTSASSVGALLNAQGSGSRKVAFPRYVESSTMQGLIEQDGEVEVEVDEQMEERAEEVSRCLELDAMQSLYLVWMYSAGEAASGEDGRLEGAFNKRAKTGTFSSSSGASQAASHATGGTTGLLALPAPSTQGVYSLAGVCHLYCDERLSLLRSLETILWIGEDPVVVSEVRDYIESDLIDGLLFGRESGEGAENGKVKKTGEDVEEVILRDLRVALRAYKQSVAYKAVIVAKGNKEDVNWANIVVQGMEKERIKMLTLLSLIYYRPRKACSVGRLEELLELGNTGVGLAHSAPVASSSASARSSTGSVSTLTVGRESRMYVLLILEILILEINGPLRDVAEHGNNGKYPFLASDVAVRITEMVRKMLVSGVTSRGSSGNSHVSVLGLTWASILLVLSEDEQQKRMGRELAQLCSSVSMGNDSQGAVLQHLSLVSLSADTLENSKQMAQLSALIVYHSLAIFLAAFDFGDDARVTGQLVDILVTLLGQDSVNDMFLYNHEDALTQPVLRFLDSLEPMGVQQLKLLTAVSSSHAGSVFASSYLLSISDAPHAVLLSPIRNYMGTSDEASLSKTAVVLNFYDALCSSNAVTVMHLLNVAVESESRSFDDFISVLGVCISRASVVGQRAGTTLLATSASTILAAAFKLLSYFVPYSPNRVLSEVLSSTGVSSASFKLDFFDQMMSKSSTEVGYKAVLALLQLVSVMLQTAYGPKAMAITMSMKMIRIAVPYISCMASSEEKWNLAAGCLTIVRYALMRSTNTASGSSTSGDPSPNISKKDVLELISPILPPECKYIANDVEHQGETEAIEKCVIKWLRLVPVLLSDGPAVYDCLFRPANGRDPPAAILLSYLSYPYFGSEDKAAVVRSMSDLLGHDSNVPVTAFLPKDGPRLSLLEPCMVISNSINADSPTHVESLFSAACDVLCNAVSYHPTLAVLLLPDLSTSGAEVGGTPSPPECSCTHHILTFAERALELYESHPGRLEKVLDVICAAITSKKSRNGIMTSLIPNMKIWKAFMDILLRSAVERAGLEGREGEEGSNESIDFHRFNVEMKVMDIFVAALCSADEDRDSESSSLWCHVDAPIKEHFDKVSTALIGRYCGIIKLMDISEEMLRCRKLSWLAGLQMMAASLDNNGLYGSLRYEQDSLVARLWTCILESNLRVQNPDQESLVELCQGLYSTFLGLEEAGADLRSTLHSEPYLSVANLLLELRDGPLPLPNQIGSAWEKVIGEFSHLEAQTRRLKQLTRLQTCLYECVSSLGSFVAVCTDRHPNLLGGGNMVADLNDIVDLVRSAIDESVAQSWDLLMGDDSLSSSIDAAVIGASRLAVLLSHRQEAQLVDEPRLFELVASLVGYYGAVDIVEECLADWLTVCINVVEGGLRSGPKADVMDTWEKAELSSILPRLLPLIDSAHTKISCAASSLVMILMATRVRPAVWEEHVESVDVAEMLGRLVASIPRVVTATDDEADPRRNIVPRIKSLLLLVSQMISESNHIASSLMSKGLGEAIVSVCHWITDALPLVGCATTAPGGTSNNGHSPPDANGDYFINFAGRYTDTGARYEVHTVWCIALSLCSLLSSALPGHRKVETLLLRVSVSMADRIALSLATPTDSAAGGSHKGLKYVTLGYLEEGRAALGFICALARLEGEWLIAQPKMVTQMRRLTAGFVGFASRGVTDVLFAAISPEELRKNGLSCHATSVRTPVLFGADPVLQLSVTGDTVGESVSEVTELSLIMAGHFYTMVKYALDFQLISAPEICEAEAMNLTLKDTWVQAQALEDLLSNVASVLDSMSMDQSSFGIDRVRTLALRLTEICEDATSLYSRISPQPPLASKLAIAAATKLRERIIS